MNTKVIAVTQENPSVLEHFFPEQIQRRRMQNAAEKERRRWWGVLLDVTALLLVLVPGVGGLEVDGLAAPRPLHVSAPLTAHRRRHNYRMKANNFHLSDSQIFRMCPKPDPTSPSQKSLKNI